MSNWVTWCSLSRTRQAAWATESRDVHWHVSRTCRAAWAIESRDVDWHVSRTRQAAWCDQVTSLQVNFITALSVNHVQSGNAAWFVRLLWPLVILLLLQMWNFLQSFCVKNVAGHTVQWFFSVFWVIDEKTVSQLLLQTIDIKLNFQYTVAVNQLAKLCCRFCEK